MIGHILFPFRKFLETIICKKLQFRTILLPCVTEKKTFIYVVVNLPPPQKKKKKKWKKKEKKITFLSIS